MLQFLLLRRNSEKNKKLSLPQRESAHISSLRLLIEKNGNRLQGAVLTEIPAATSAGLINSEIPTSPAQLYRHPLLIADHTAYLIKNELVDCFFVTRMLVQRIIVSLIACNRHVMFISTFIRMSVPSSELSMISAHVRCGPLRGFECINENFVFFFSPLWGFKGKLGATYTFHLRLVANLVVVL